MRNINTVANFLVIWAFSTWTASGVTFASDLSDLQAAREKAQNDYMAAMIAQKASTPAAKAAIRHQIMDPVEAAMKDFNEHKMGSGPRGPVVPIRPLTVNPKLSSNSSSGPAPVFQGISSTHPVGNGDSKPTHQDVVLDGSKIPKELVFEKQNAQAQNPQRALAGSAGSAKGSSAPKSGSQLAPKNTAVIKQFNETSDLLKLDKYSDPVH